MTSDVISNPSDFFRTSKFKLSDRYENFEMDSQDELTYKNHTEIYPENENIIDEDSGDHIKTQESALANNHMIFAKHQFRFEDS